VKQFFVEVFTARVNAGKLATAECRATLAARRLSGADREVQFVRATYIPEDEICFFVFDATSGSDAALAVRGAGLEPIRVVEAVSSQKEKQ
jgi:hypothetical protein